MYAAYSLEILATEGRRCRDSGPTSTCPTPTASALHGLLGEDRELGARDEEDSVSIHHREA